ncbi:CASP-like protein 1F2 [Andrographis paniculata]|uniref:CASP-like protein 1F2 n=1 Tax=Andrographis paniculata TaxID=175694 RepID=UPI0021E77879|nr:CASP-like protein 1F2 [Andrographis paniculata]
MATIADKSIHTPPQSQRANANNSIFFITSQVLLRSLLFALTLAAACLMLTSKQTVEVYGIEATASYTHSPAFQFFTYVNIVAFVLSIASAFLAFLLEKGALSPQYYLYLFLHDLILVAIFGSACAASTAVGWVGKYGNSHTGWTAICDHFGRFCNRIIAAVVLAYIGLALFMILTAISAKRIASSHG